MNGLVRSKKDLTQQPRVVFEFHQYFGLCQKADALGERACGPFFAVTGTPEDVLAGVGLGWMFGWRATTSPKGEGFSVGIGAMLDGGVKSLADGFEKSQPPPAGETSIRIEEKARWSGLLFFTRTF